MKLGKWIAVAGCLGFGAVSVLTAPGCTVDASTANDGGFGGGDSSTTTPDAGNVACNQCLYDSCATQYAICHSDPDCAAIFNCLTANANDRACYDAHAAGQARYNALSTCDVSASTCQCATSCGLATSCPVPDAGPTTDDAGNPVDAAPAVDAGPTLSACDQCTSQKCASDYANCHAGSGAECDKYQQCTAACTGSTPEALSACVSQCGTTYPTGAQQSQAYGACAFSNCATECGG